MAGASLSAADERRPGHRWISVAGESSAGFTLDTFWHDVEGRTTALEAVLESGAGQLFTEVRVEAIISLGLLEAEEGERLGALAAGAAIAVLLAAGFLWRVANRQWERPKLVTLFGLLVVEGSIVPHSEEVFLVVLVTVAMSIVASWR